MSSDFENNRLSRYYASTDLWTGSEGWHIQESSDRLDLVVLQLCDHIHLYRDKLIRIIEMMPKFKSGTSIDIAPLLLKISWDDFQGAVDVEQRIKDLIDSHPKLYPHLLLDIDKEMELNRDRFNACLRHPRLAAIKTGLYNLYLSLLKQQKYHDKRFDCQAAVHHHCKLAFIRDTVEDLNPQKANYSI